jgi:hypothetical protein
MRQRVDYKSLNYGGLAVGINADVAVGVALKSLVVGVAIGAGLGVVFAVAMCSTK